MSDAEVVAGLKRWLLSRRVKGRSKTAGEAAWYVMSQILGVGCSHATEWCEANGIDPHTRVKVRV